MVYLAPSCIFRTSNSGTYIEVLNKYLLIGGMSTPGTKKKSGTSPKRNLKHSAFLFSFVVEISFLLLLLLLFFLIVVSPIQSC